MEPTKEEYVDWRDNIVTQAFFTRLNERFEDLKEVLVNDPNERLAGYINALRDIKNTDFGDLE